MVVWVVQLNHNKHTKIAVVVSKRVNKKAIMRNKYKRQILANISQNLSKIPNKNHLIIISVKSNINKMNNNDLKIDILRFLNNF